MRVFVTGASGWIGSPLVRDLIGSGHHVVGLARSDASATALAAAGAEVQRGSLDDLDTLRGAASSADGVIHLAFKHEIAFSGGFEDAADADRRAIETFGEVLAGSDRPFVIASGTLGLAPGRLVAEHDGLRLDPSHAHHTGGVEARRANALLTLSFVSRGVRSSVVRLPPTVHGQGDHGFMAALVGIARQRGVSAYIGDGSNRWPAVHRLDAARLFQLALQSAPAGSVLHAVADEGVQFRAIAEAIGRQLNLAVVAIAPEDAIQHFGFLGALAGIDGPASSALTRQLLAWRPTQPGLIDDLDQGHYVNHQLTLVQ